jgi:hypothetical protein
VFAGAPAGTGGDAAGLTPAAVQQLPEPLKTGVIDAFTDALAPAFWYLVPVIAVGVVLAFFLREVKLSDVAGMVARGEALAADGTGAPGAAAQDEVVLDELSAAPHGDVEDGLHGRPHDASHDDGSLVPSPHGAPDDDRVADGLDDVADGDPAGRR